MFLDIPQLERVNLLQQNMNDIETKHSLLLENMCVCTEYVSNVTTQTVRSQRACDRHNGVTRFFLENM
jgi:hypothetical protein